MGANEKFDDLTNKMKGEKRRKNFERLAATRTAKAIKAIRLIGNLSGPNYSYTEKHVDQILDALEAELGGLRGRFKRKEVDKPVFEFIESTD